DQYLVPEDAASGLCAARVCLIGQDPDTALTIPFAVVRHTPRRPGTIALLLSTNTWHAYGRIPRNDLRVPGLTSSFYTRHLNERPFFHLGLRAPIPHATPYGYETERAAHTRHSHLVRPERFAQAWLEQEGYPFECLTDLDLHAEPTVLRNFQVLLICGHNEYWSDAMRDGVRAYLDAGGRVLCMSGNTLYWRVSFDEDLMVMESRKTSGTEDGEWLPPSQWGERWHSTDGRPGGTWHLLGQPSHEVIGLSMQGMIDDGTPTAFAAFQVEAPSHFLFHEPESVPLTAQGTIGERNLNGPKASGYEMDATPQTVGILAEPIPGMVTLAGARGQFSIEYAGADPFHGADLIYWERPGGGQVVNAGSIGFSGALAVDPGVRALIRNVLAHFGVPHGRQLGGN
ncbi:MAG TPA: N,N-dimethylformamidase beta subunit family domain-containing protein, partial [Chloroflexota bacterium]|nr:N,N-dimethylformamidase beta subunit family domain-containing protein [Chloroflexota bacterium]